MSRQSLELRTGQQLTLTPALQQSIRILQLSTLDLEAEVARALAENPMLETEGEADMNPLTPAQSVPTTLATGDLSEAAKSSPDYDERDVIKADAEPVEVVDDYSENSDTALSADYRATKSSVDDDQDDRPEAALQNSLREFLLEQLALTRFSQRDAALVEMLIDELTADGLLASSLEEIVSWMNPKLGLTVEDFSVALSLLQSFDPPGIGARDLSECLDLQLAHADLNRLPELKDQALLATTRELVRHYLPVLASGNMNKLCEALDCDLKHLKRAHALILKLNPRPAANWTKPVADFAVPDVVVRKTNKGWRVFLNESVMPKLRVNELYAQALGSPRSGANAPLHGQLQEARFLIRNVAQRFDTIKRVSEVIVIHQQAFFTQGWGAIRPLTLKDIAAEIGMHESTISRATTQKYMLTPFGTVELKRFFSTGLVTQGGGESTSATAIQTRIKLLIDAEDRSKPLSDSQLVSLLESNGVNIARRTVAKYRELMRIPTAPLRRSQAQAN
jgi:RNA polymerase sigma-54 factor